MPALARADLESLLRARKLDATLTTSSPLRRTEDEVAPSGSPALDARLGGGWPRGQVSEIVGPRASGRSAIAVASLAAATRRGELAVLVDTFDAFDPASAQPADPAWPHLLWVRGAPLAHTRVRAAARGGTRPDVALMATALDRAVKAAALVLAAGGFGMVVLDVSDVPAPLLGALPFTTWLRLQRLVEGGQTACVLVVPQPLGRSAGGVSVHLSAPDDDAARWRGGSDRSRLFAGHAARARIGRARAVHGAGEPFGIWPPPAASAATGTCP